MAIFRRVLSLISKATRQQANALARAPTFTHAQAGTHKNAQALTPPPTHTQRKICNTYWFFETTMVL